jgi:hypothetical protein
LCDHQLVLFRLQFPSLLFKVLFQFVLVSRGWGLSAFCLLDFLLFFFKLLLKSVDNCLVVVHNWRCRFGRHNRSLLQFLVQGCDLAASIN